MSHPAPSEKPSNPDNPRVFFDVDIGGERGQDYIFNFNVSGQFLRASLTLSLVSLAQAWLILVFSRNRIFQHIS